MEFTDLPSHVIVPSVTLSKVAPGIRSCPQEHGGREVKDGEFHVLLADGEEGTLSVTCRWVHFTKAAFRSAHIISASCRQNESAHRRTGVGALELCVAVDRYPVGV